MALSEVYSYSGGDGGDRWRTKTRGILISKIPALLPILDWAEEFDEQKITENMWVQKKMQENWMTEVSISRPSEVVRGFLNTCLKGEAHTTFETADLLNGLDGWRLVVQDIQRGRNVRMATLRKLINNPPTIARVEDVAAGIVKYQNLIKEYKAVGGEPPNEKEQKTDLLDSLPQELRDNLLWRSVNDEKFVDFQNHVKATANTILFHRGKLPSSINAVETGPSGNTSNIGNSIEDVIGALMKKLGYGQRNGPLRGGAEPRKPPAGDRPRRCVNCGSDKHPNSDCPKPRVPLNKRPCYECGVPGHVAANCRKKNNPKANLVDDDDNEEFFGCIDCDQASGKFPKVESQKQGAKTRLMPKPVTLIDFIPTKIQNKYGELEEDEDEEAKSKRQRKREAAKTMKQLRKRKDEWEEEDQDGSKRAQSHERAQFRPARRDHCPHRVRK